MSNCLPLLWYEIVVCDLQMHFATAETNYLTDHCCPLNNFNDYFYNRRYFEHVFAFFLLQKILHFTRF